MRNQGDGWGYTLDYLARAGEEVGTGEDGLADADDALGGYFAFATAMGRRLGELHAVLATDTDAPEFRPEVADDAVLAEWGDGAAEQVEGAVAALRQALDGKALVDGDRERAEGIVASGEALAQAARSLARNAGKAMRTRVHGDFHLGQVLVVQGDAFLIDFEGEPARTMEQRRAKSSPLRDVAGLLRSFDYAAATAATARTAESGPAAQARAQVVERFRTGAAEHFLSAYRAVLRSSATPWVGEAEEAAVLDLFLLEKAAYEVRYEAANRPGWIGIPLAGLAAIAGRLPGMSPPSTQTQDQARG